MNQDEFEVRLQEKEVNPPLQIDLEHVKSEAADSAKGLYLTDKSSGPLYAIRILKSFPHLKPLFEAVLMNLYKMADIPTLTPPTRTNSAEADLLEAVEMLDFIGITVDPDSLKEVVPAINKHSLSRTVLETIAADQRRFNDIFRATRILAELKLMFVTHAPYVPYPKQRMHGEYGYNYVPGSQDPMGSYHPLENGEHKVEFHSSDKPPSGLLREAMDPDIKIAYQNQVNTIVTAAHEAIGHGLFTECVGHESFLIVNSRRVENNITLANTINEGFGRFIEEIALQVLQQEIKREQTGNDYFISNHIAYKERRRDMLRDDYLGRKYSEGEQLIAALLTQLGIEGAGHAEQLPQLLNFFSNMDFEKTAAIRPEDDEYAQSLVTPLRILKLKT